MRLWEKLSKEDKLFFKRMDSYESLPVEQRLEKFREEVRYYEQKILEITGDPFDGTMWRLVDSENKMDTIFNYLGNRGYALSKMFEIHCSDVEVARIEHLNAKLLELSQQMFKRTGSYYRYILDMPLEEKDDDIEIEGTLRFWDDGKGTILKLEDDAFYGSDFQKMIPIISFIEREHKGDLAFIECHPHWRRSSGHTSSMTDKELDIENTLDDELTWAESWLHHPKLEHIKICYATHAIVTHNEYSIPDFMRLNDFEIKVEMKLQQFSEQDGSRLGWWTSCGECQFIDKFLHEAKHRPSEMSLGEFIYKRGIEYFDIDGWDRSDCDTQERMNKINKNGEKDARIEEYFPGTHQAQLPDCSRDDSLVEPFLKKLYEMMMELNKTKIN